MRLQQTTFGNTDKQRNCSKQANSPFATVFSTLFNYYIITYRDFSHICLDVFQVVCCRFGVCRKGLRSSGIESYESIKPYVVDTQKKCCHEMNLLSKHNIWFKCKKMFFWNLKYPSYLEL